MIHSQFSHSLYSTVLKGKTWAKVEMTAFLTRPNDSPPRTQLNRSLLEEGIKKETRLGKINVDIIAYPDNWFTPWNVPDNETVFAVRSLAGAQGFLSNALSLSP